MCQRSEKGIASVLTLFKVVSAKPAREISGKRCGHGVPFPDDFESVKVHSRLEGRRMKDLEKSSRSRRNAASRCSTAVT